jgi:hypothetical protein
MCGRPQERERGTPCRSEPADGASTCLCEACCACSLVGYAHYTGTGLYDLPGASTGESNIAYSSFDQTPAQLIFIMRPCGDSVSAPMVTVAS